MLLLDDVFAELDSGRRDRLAALVAGAEQVLVTAAVPDDVPAPPGRGQVRGLRRGGVACLTTPTGPGWPARPSPRRRRTPSPRATAPRARTISGRHATSRANRPRRARPGRRPRRDDPEPLSAAIDGLIDTRGWREAAAAGSVFGRWAQIVGPDLAAHTRPESLADGELTVTADSTAWATQVRLLAAQLVRRLNAELGDGIGAAGQGPRARGRRARPGGPASGGCAASRGPRDTYG